MHCKKRGWQFLFLIILLYQMLYADTPDQEKLYAVPQALITYKISGGGILGEDLNLTLEGSGKRRFKEWGDVELYETHIVEKTEGMIKYIKHQDRCEKRKKQEVLDVDYENKKIMERPLPKRKNISNETNGMGITGQQMVANIICDMWEGKGVKKCFYKGIPLFTEYYALGFFYREEAMDIDFDTNISDPSKCSVPPYPKQKFALYTNSFKTKNIKKVPEVFSDRLLAVIAYLKKKKKDEEALSPNERKGLKEMMGEPIFRNQKVLLPKLLETMKQTRACLSQAQNTEKANSCLYDMIAMKSYFTGNEHNRIEDWNSSKNEILEKFETHIALLQSKMKCIRSAKMLSDLAKCMNQ